MDRIPVKINQTGESYIDFLNKNPCLISQTRVSIVNGTVVMDCEDYFKCTIATLPKSVAELVEMGFISLLSWKLTDYDIILTFRQSNGSVQILH